MELLTIILLAILFIASLINIYVNINYYDNKTFQMFKSFIYPKTLLTPPPQHEHEHEKQQQPSSVNVVPRQKDEERRKVFATFDKNGDGYITKQELIESLKNIRIMLSDDEVEDLVAGVDENGDGFIDFEEFCKFCELRQDEKKVEKEDEDEDEEEEDEDLKEAFDVFDKDKDGMISVEELGSVLCSLGLREGKRVEDCKEMIKKIDVDGDGMVSFLEFKLMMTSTNGASLISAF